MNLCGIIDTCYCTLGFVMNYLKEIIEETGIEISELLPKQWIPKNEYVEMYKGLGIDYKECIVLKTEMNDMIRAGWSITRLSKISMSMVYSKWRNAIIAME